MATLAGLVGLREIEFLVRNGVTHKLIADYYLQTIPGSRGISERSVRRLCQSHNITRLSDEELDAIVVNFV